MKKVCAELGFATSKFRKTPGLTGKDMAYSKHLALEKLLLKKKKREEKQKTKLEKLRDSGLVGCLNDSGVTSGNYKEYINGN